MLSYPARLESQPEGGYAVTFRDVPEAITQGNTVEDALSEAAGALVTAMEFYFEDNSPVPAPSKARKGEHEVSLSTSIATKVLLLNRMIQEKKRLVDVARSMHVKPQEVTRIMDLHHAIKIDTIADAFGALGRRLEIRVA